MKNNSLKDYIKFLKYELKKLEAKVSCTKQPTPLMIKEYIYNLGCLNTAKFILKKGLK